jgi:hypothetical protein
MRENDVTISRDPPLRGLQETDRMSAARRVGKWLNQPQAEGEGKHLGRQQMEYGDILQQKGTLRSFSLVLQALCNDPDDFSGAFFRDGGSHPSVGDLIELTDTV